MTFFLKTEATDPETMGFLIEISFYDRGHV